MIKNSCVRKPSYEYSFCQSFTPRQVWIVGASGLGRLYFDYFYDVQNALQTNIPVAGFLDNIVAKTPTPLLESIADEYTLTTNLQVLPIDGFRPEPNDMFIAAMGKPENKVSFLYPLRALGAKFITLVHPTATVHSSVFLGEGCVVGPHVTLCRSVSIDAFCNFYVSAYIGEGVSISDACSIFARSTVLQDAQLEECVSVYTGALVSTGIILHSSSKVAIGSVVIKEVASGTTVMGNPARVIAMQ